MIPFLNQGFNVKRITLVRFKDELFPRSEADFQTLRDSQVTVFRIPTSLLEYLKETLLKKVKVSIVDFPSVYREGMLRFQSAVLEPNGIRSKMDRNTTVLGYPKDLLEMVNDSCSGLSNQMGRYGFKVHRENKPDHRRPDTHLVSRLEVIADPDLNPSYYFGDYIPEFTDNSVISLSPSARLCFRSRPSRLNPGKTTFSLEFQDKFGDEWVTAFSRAFDLNFLNRDEVSSLVNQMISLSNASEHYVPPVTPKTGSRK